VCEWLSFASSEDSRSKRPPEFWEPHHGRSNKEQAFAWLEREFQERRGTLANATLLGPYLDRLRGDPRYADLLRRMGLRQ
jgi:hypothetical protein